MSLVTTDILHIWRQQPAREPDQIFFDFNLKYEINFLYPSRRTTLHLDTYGPTMSKSHLLKVHVNFVDLN